MDSALVSSLFRRLATHNFCQTSRRCAVITRQRRWLSEEPRSRLLPREARSNARTTADGTKVTTEGRWQPRLDILPPDKTEEYCKFPMVTADELRTRRQRPRRVKMLMRDFIEDSLYNPSYGYFSKNVVIFNPGAPFNFNQIKDEPEFAKILGQRYSEFEDELDTKEYNDTRQLWHTPTELFRPYYAEAIARYMVANYKLSLYPYHDLLIYELGAGNGTLMLNILDYIRAVDPEVYARTKFRIIEVSTQLAKLQSQAAAKGHADRVEIINISIFDWTTYVPTPCFFVAMEVFDNFAHDVIRYHPITEQPLQGQVLINNEGEFFDIYTPDIDPVAARFLHVREVACRDRRFAHPLGGPRFLRQLRHSLPGAPELTPPEYIPTRLMNFFHLLSQHFPAHRLITSDFHWLPQAIKGYNAPVVQTRYQRKTVLVSTPLVRQGYFDILFPTDFGVVEDMYRAITGRFTRVSTHEDFFGRWAYAEDTQMKSGENALLGHYKNASVMITV